MIAKKTSDKTCGIARAPLPRAANPECVPIECMPDEDPDFGTSGIKINELISNPKGNDGGQEWVELYNTGSETWNLDGWSIETATSSWSIDFIFPGGVSIDPGQFFEHVEAPVSDLQVQGFSLFDFRAGKRTGNYDTGGLSR